MAIVIPSAIPEPFVDAPGEVSVSSAVPEGFTNAPGTVQMASMIVEVFKTFGCVGAEAPLPLPTAQSRLIRRLRRAPHLSAEEVRQFFASFQLDLQAGVGLSTGQGLDPLVCLRWSDNGGKTWSNEHFVSAGKVGQYARRALWRRLGYGRDRVFEVTVSDPVAWRLLDAYLQVGQGTS